MMSPRSCVFLMLCVVSAVGVAIPSGVSQGSPLAVDQSLVALESEAILDDPEVLVCHGPEDCNNHGVCDMSNLCRCAPGWGGIDCTIEFTCPNDCSGNGVCRAHSCFCYHGYTGRDCSISLFCPNNCNGNGKCDRGNCVCDAGFDGPDCSREVGCAYSCAHGTCSEQVCVCEEGYYGPDCSDIDYCLTDCSNHGTCRDKRCICDFGYTGVVCSTQIPCPNNCSHRGECINGTCSCDLGSTGLDCSEDCCPDQNVQCSAGKMCSYPPCHCHNDCNDNGICHRGRCICRRGYFGDDCALKRCLANCSNRGSCDHSVGECTCDDGWKGEDCSQVECLNDCSNRGECTLFGGTSRICLCEEGFMGADCSQEVPCPNDCSAHGKCAIGICSCESGWDGLDCSDEVDPWEPCEMDCYGHGECEEGICQCEDGWKGRFCQEEKVVVVKADGTVECPGEPECSSHGLCAASGKCFCAEGYLGEDCSIKECPDNCNDRGECKNGVCMCNSPYHSGLLQSCELIRCPANCSGPTRGNCNKNTGQCSCIPPWETEDCSVQPCPGEPQCSDQGECDDQTGVCECLPDYTGEDCSTYMRCPNDCSGNGVCYRGTCYCYSNYTGDSCKQVMRPPPPPGFDWQAPLKEAQVMFATSRSSSPPQKPMPSSVSINQKKDLFREAFGADWARFWNMVHETEDKKATFTRCVTEEPPSLDSSDEVEANQKKLFDEVFGEFSSTAWTKMMVDDQVRSSLLKMFEEPVGTYGDDTAETATRGDGLPPPPPPARDAFDIKKRQELFTDVFGQGPTLAMEMLIFANKTKRDLFASAFSSFLRENMARGVQDKRDKWEDDMMQLMTDSLGAEGPPLLGEIFRDPKRAKLFRDAFAGYLEVSRDSINTLMELDEGSSSASTSPSLPIPSSPSMTVSHPPLKHQARAEHERQHQADVRSLDRLARLVNPVIPDAPKIQVVEVESANRAVPPPV